MRLKIKKILISIIISGLLCFIYSFIEPYILVNKKYNLSNSDNSSGIKIVFLTDIHVGPYFSQNRLKRLVERVNKLNPDIILLGGDYVHRDAKYIPIAFSELKHLKAKCFIGAVLGNHDHWESKEISYVEMKKAQIISLDNVSQRIKIGTREIEIYGVGDLYEDRQLLETDNKKLKSSFNILVSHNPDYIERINPNILKKIDLILSGHTHGGQVSFFGLWAPLVPSQYGQKYRTGHKTIGSTQIIISNGIGTITPPVRFFAFPQVCIIEI